MNQMDSDEPPISIHWGPSVSSKDHHRCISDVFPSQRFTPTPDWDEWITTDTQPGRKLIGDIGRTNDYRGEVCDGISANPGLIDDGSNHLRPPKVASNTVDTLHQSFLGKPNFCGA